MVELFLQAVFAQAVLAAVGLAIVQLLSRKRVGIGDLPLGWSLGILYLYLAGQLLTPVSLLQHRWHWVVLLFGVVCMLTGALRFRRLKKNESSAPRRWHWAEYTLAAVIAIRLLMIGWAMCMNPTIDSDAAETSRWVGLAKTIADAGYWPEEVVSTDRYSPSLLPMWTAAFMSRWHDSLVVLPWWITYVALTALLAMSCRAFTENRLAGLLLAYGFCALPLGTMHVLRPGFVDLLECFFVAVGMHALLCQLQNPTQRRATALIVCAAMGCAMTKIEGLFWGLSLVMICLTLAAHQRWSIPWRKILGVQAILILAAYGTYWVSADWVRNAFELGVKLDSIFIKQFDRTSLTVFSKLMLGSGTFDLWWWLVGIMSAMVLVGRTPRSDKIIVVYLLCLVLLVAYYSVCTGGVKWTLLSTGPGRFLLQVSAVMLPIYSLFVRNLLGRNRESA